MTIHAERLYQIAQRLDELSEDLPELADLCEELGKIADAWPQPKPREVGETPEYLRQIQQIVERRAEEILVGRYGSKTTSPYLTINIPNYYNSGLLDPKSLAEITGI